MSGQDVPNRGKIPAPRKGQHPQAAPGVAPAPAVPAPREVPTARAKPAAARRVAGLVAALGLLATAGGGVGYLAWQTFAPAGEVVELIPVSPGVERSYEQELQAKRQRQERREESHRVHPAALPWSRDAARPSALPAGESDVERRRGWTGGLAEARLPPLPDRPRADRPLPADLRQAALPWAQDPSRPLEAQVRPANLPPLPRDMAHRLQAMAGKK